MKKEKLNELESLLNRLDTHKGDASVLNEQQKRVVAEGEENIKDDMDSLYQTALDNAHEIMPNFFSSKPNASQLFCFARVQDKSLRDEYEEYNPKEIVKHSHTNYPKKDLLGHDKLSIKPEKLHSNGILITIILTTVILLSIEFGVIYTQLSETFEPPMNIILAALFAIVPSTLIFISAFQYYKDNSLILSRTLFVLAWIALAIILLFRIFYEFDPENPDEAGFTLEPDPNIVRDTIVFGAVSLIAMLLIYFWHTRTYFNRAIKVLRQNLEEFELDLPVYLKYRASNLDDELRKELEKESKFKL